MTYAAILKIDEYSRQYNPNTKTSIRSSKGLRMASQYYILTEFLNLCKSELDRYPPEVVGDHLQVTPREIGSMMLDAIQENYHDWSIKNLPWYGVSIGTTYETIKNVRIQTIKNCIIFLEKENLADV